MIGAKDVGFNGKCPSPTSKYSDTCCCGNGCCWKRCNWENPPDDCLSGLYKGQWLFDPSKGYYYAVSYYEGSGRFTKHEKHCLDVNSNFTYSLQFWIVVEKSNQRNVWLKHFQLDQRILVENVQSQHLSFLEFVAVMVGVVGINVAIHQKNVCLEFLMPDGLRTRRKAIIMLLEAQINQTFLWLDQRMLVVVVQAQLTNMQTLAVVEMVVVGRDAIGKIHQKNVCLEFQMPDG